MKKKLQLFLRDLLFLALFFVLVGVLVRRLSRFINVHKQSIIHELDDTLLNQLEKTRDHCLRAFGIFQNLLTDQERNYIASSIKKIEDLETQYKKNSHGLILLGPIGSVSIVLKERRVKAELLAIIIDLNRIFSQYSKQQPQKRPIESIEDGLAINQQLLF